MQKTFEELSQIWSETKRPLVKYSTMCAYRLALQTHLLPHFGQKNKIDEDEVQRFIIHKVELGLAKKSIRDIIAILRSIIKYGARHGLFDGEDWQLYYPTVETDNRLSVLSINHQRKLMAHLLKEPNSQNIGILLALCTGMRIGEVCALQWTDVDLPHRMLRVSQTVGRIYNCDLRATEFVLSTPKTKHSFREIPISKQLFEALRVVKKQSSSAFVVGSLAHAVDPRSYRDNFARLLKRLQIPPITFHGLRHRDFYKPQIINSLN